MGYDPNTLMQNAITFANQMKENMVIVGNNATGAFSNLTYPYADFTPPWVYGGSISLGAPPSAPQVSTGVLNQPVLPIITGVTTPSFDAPPTFTMAAPVINLPTAPDATLPTSPGSAPQFSAPTVPNSPSVTLPDVPVFENLNIPVAPTVNLPQFTSTLAVADIAEPSATFSFVEQPYQSALMDSLKAKLLADMLNGGYGIEARDEQELWERTKERELRNTEAAIQDGLRQMASRGWSMPQGAVNAMMEARRQEGLEKISSASRDIALKRADMYVENRRFTIEQVRETEQLLMNYFGFMMERALNSAKAIVELGISVYNAKLAKFQYQLDRYRAQAQVFETTLRAALANLEAYKVQVEGVRLAADVQRIHAEVYRTQLEGVQALTNVYRTQMEGARLFAEVEKLKLDAFRTSVETYTAQVGAKQAEFGMYESRIRGEMAKVNVFQAGAQAYGIQVEGFKSNVQAARTILDAQIEPNKLKLEQYRADIARYSSELQRAQVEISAALGRYDAQIRGYSVNVDASIKAAEVGLQNSKANADIAMSSAKLKGDIAVASSNVALGAANTFAHTQAGLAGAYGSVSAAALGAAQGMIAQISTV